MRKKFVTNLALVIFLNLLVKPFWIFGIDRTVQNVVGAEAYGFYFVLLNFSLILNILLDMGITNFNNRNIAQNSQLLNKHFSNLIILRVLLGVMYFLICMGVAILSDYSFEQIKLLVILTFNQFLLSFILYLRSNIAGLQLFKTDSIISVLDRFLMIFICGILLWGHITHVQFKIQWFVYAQTAAYGITSVIAFFVVLWHSGKIKLRFDTGFSYAILKQSFPYALLTLLMAFYNRVDSIMLERLLPDGNLQAGIYAQAFRILDAASMFAILFAGLLLPMFAKMLKTNEPIGQLTKLSFTLIIVPAIIVSLVCFFFRSQIMELLYHSHVTDSANIFAILMLGFVSVSVSYIFGTLLTANGNLKQLNIMALCGMTINIALNLILIPRYQALGSATASFITQSATALIQIFLAIKVFKLNFNYKLLILLLIFAAGVILIGFAVNKIPLNWLIQLSIMTILSCAWALATGLIKIKNIYMIIKNNE